ncbi:hypothetical protein BO221_14035 [Archangium sp. Cb G35]|uniref:hypothetical protein n=1 Tax=Archangium sp. Cb G35 TaxID=1920190 RepID=UPI000935F95C|nr:hypothetical protein [Archangium sp. Cb G35]OJT24291.1 hypothetical protein BO221_14035 [Archangium sp. Cb G35]
MTLGPSKDLWLKDPDRAREIERQAQQKHAVTPGGAPRAQQQPYREQLSLFTTQAEPCRACKLLPEQSGRTTYRHACCGAWMCLPCHNVEMPAGFACIPADELRRMP